MSKAATALNNEYAHFSQPILYIFRSVTSVLHHLHSVHGQPIRYDSDPGNPLSIRQKRGADSLPLKVQVLFCFSAIPLVAGVVLLDKVLIDSNQKAVVTVGIALVGFIAFVSAVQRQQLHNSEI